MCLDSFKENIRISIMQYIINMKHKKIIQTLIWENHTNT